MPTLTLTNRVNFYLISNIMELKGMSPKEFIEVIDFVEKHHYFAKWLSDEERQKEVEKYPKITEHGLNVKYVESCYDTRTGDVWKIKFRGFNQLSFSTNSLIGYGTDTLPYETLYDWVMSFLKGEWLDEDILKDCEFD
jgi:hypothetical protein